MADIQDFLIDLMAAHEDTPHKHFKWFSRLKPFFDHKFGRCLPKPTGENLWAK
jgi:hypothetical protein